MFIYPKHICIYRLIGLGVNIHAGSDIRDGSLTAAELIREANGFAQVGFMYMYMYSILLCGIYRILIVYDVRRICKYV